MKRLTLLATLLLAGCATMHNDKTVCPEYRKLRCATEVQCSWDDARQCRTCQCAPARDGVYVEPPGTPPLTH